MIALIRTMNTDKSGALPGTAVARDSIITGIYSPIVIKGDSRCMYN